MASRSSTATTFVFLVTFLGIFALLVNNIPQGFVPVQDIREPPTRDDWIRGLDIGNFTYTDSRVFVFSIHGKLTHGFFLGIPRI